jgi:CheY-like chemotaxis protein
VAQRIRGNRETTEALLIALTGYGGPHDSQQDKDAGFDVHLVKPVAVSALLESMRKAPSRQSQPSGKSRGT